MVAMLSASSDGPYMPDIPMQPRDRGKTVGPEEPRRRNSVGVDVVMGLTVGQGRGRWQGGAPCRSCPRGFPPPGTSPLSPLPSPSHRPGEGDFAEAVVLVGGVFKAGNDAENISYRHHRLSRVPLSRTAGGRWER